MLKYRNHLIPTFFFLILGIALFIVIYAGHTFPNETFHLNKNEVTLFNTGWYYMKDNQKTVLDLTDTFSWHSENKLILQNYLPKLLPEDSILCLETYHQSLKVYLDEELIYQYGINSESYSERGFGNVWNFISIPQNASGKEIKLELLSAYHGAVQKVYPIYLGNRNSTIFYLFRNHLDVIIFCALFIILGILFFLFSIVIRIKPFGIQSQGIFYFSIFLLMSSIWMITDSKIIQFFIRTTVEPYLISFFTFLLLPVPFLLFLNSICIHSKKILNCLCITFLLNFVADVTLYLSNILDLIITLPIMHLILIITLFIVIFICVQERLQYKNTDVSPILWGIILMALFSIFSMFQFYMGNKIDNSSLFQYGLALFLIFLSIHVFKQSLSMLSLSTKAETYQKLAYIDSMTQLSNQSAFHMLMDKLPDTINQCFSIGFIVFDLNNLKRVNDRYGHSAGDTIIQGLASCIYQAFEPFGQCFRTGGDEFTVVLTNRTEDDIKIGMEQLQEYRKNFNQCHRDPIEAAYGYALTNISKEETIVDIKELYNEADKNMLKEKAKNKDHYRTF